MTEVEGAQSTGQLDFFLQSNLLITLGRFTGAWRRELPRRELHYPYNVAVPFDRHAIICRAEPSFFISHRLHVATATLAFYLRIF
jgi:hypothetical protein